MHRYISRFSDIIIIVMYSDCNFSLVCRVMFLFI